MNTDFFFHDLNVLLQISSRNINNTRKPTRKLGKRLILRAKLMGRLDRGDNDQRRRKLNTGTFALDHHGITIKKAKKPVKVVVLRAQII